MYLDGLAIPGETKKPLTPKPPLSLKVTHNEFSYQGQIWNLFSPTNNQFSFHIFKQFWNTVNTKKYKSHFLPITTCSYAHSAITHLLPEKWHSSLCIYILNNLTSKRHIIFIQNIYAYSRLHSYHHRTRSVDGNHIHNIHLHNPGFHRIQDSVRYLEMTHFILHRLYVSQHKGYLMGMTTCA